MPWFRAESGEHHRTRNAQVGTTRADIQAMGHWEGVQVLVSCGVIRSRRSEFIIEIDYQN
jgi:hypothetical protein